jgi:hypothetical protein
VRYKDIRVGNKYKIVGNNRGNPTLKIGTIITVKRKQSSTYIEVEELPGYWWVSSDFGPATTDLITLQKELTNAEELVKQIQAKLAYMAEAQTNDFDEDEYRCYEALKIAEDTTRSKLERSKALAQLIKK